MKAEELFELIATLKKKEASKVNRLLEKKNIGWGIYKKVTPFGGTSDPDNDGDNDGGVPDDPTHPD